MASSLCRQIDSQSGEAAMKSAREMLNHSSLICLKTAVSDRYITSASIDAFDECFGLFPRWLFKACLMLCLGYHDHNDEEYDRLNEWSFLNMP